MNAFTIKDLENLSGIKAHTIRIWEQRYSFLHPVRTETNIRSYSNNELQTVLNIALLNKYGFKISHIDRMTPVEMNEKILSLAQVQAQQERLVNELISCMVNIRMERGSLLPAVKLIFSLMNSTDTPRSFISLTSRSMSSTFLASLSMEWTTSVSPGRM